jgi:hypothetical protein
MTAYARHFQKWADAEDFATAQRNKQPEPKAQQ